MKVIKLRPIIVIQSLLKTDVFDRNTISGVMSMLDSSLQKPFREKQVMEIYFNFM